MMMSVRELAVVIGKVAATSKAGTQAPLHYRALQNLVIPKYDSQITLTSKMVMDLNWWATLYRQAVEAAICLTQPVMIIESDAKVWGHQHRRELVNRRSSQAHQFPGAYSCLSHPQNLCPQPDRHDSVKNGQHLCNEFISTRREASPTVQPSSGDMGMVPAETDITTSRAPTCLLSHLCWWQNYCHFV